MSYFELSHYDPQSGESSHFVCLLYGEEKDVLEYYSGKKCTVGSVNIIGPDGKILKSGENPSGILYKMIHDYNLKNEYILAANESQAEKIYEHYCYSNAVKPLTKSEKSRRYAMREVTELVAPVKLCRVVREGDTLSLLI